MVVTIVKPINNGPWGAIAMLATRIIAVQKFGVIGDGQVAREFDIGVALLLGNKAPQLRMSECHCDKGKIECQTLVINITAINKSIKTQL